MVDFDYRILVVDGDKALVEFVSTVLTQELRCKVDSVADGKAALKKCTDDNVDLVLLDILLPEQDGFEIVKRLKQIQVPFVTMTPILEKQHVHHLLGIGSFSFLAKPMSETQLLGTVISALSHVSHIEGMKGFADSATELGMAKGAIAAYLSIDPDEAFEVLNEMARDAQSNVKETASTVTSFLEFLGRAKNKHTAQQERSKKRRSRGDPC